LNDYVLEESCVISAFSSGVGLCQTAVFLPSCSAEIQSDDAERWWTCLLLYFGHLARHARVAAE